MLTPIDIQTLPQNISNIYQELEEFIIADIGRRISSSSAITETALHQIRSLQYLGYDMREIDIAIMKANNLAYEELDKMYTEAVERGHKFENKLYDKAGLVKPPAHKQLELLNTVKILNEQTKEDLFNYTRTLGFAEIIDSKVVYKPIAKYYQDALDFAHMQITSGAVDYNTAIKQAINKMAKSGVRTVDYAGGWSNNIEVAVRRATMSGLSQTSAVMAEQNMKILDTDLVEVSAHPGARPEHALWQGKIYSMSGKSKKYPSLVKVTGYGTGPGLCGWNCYHTFYPFIEGVSERQYTDKELKNIEGEPFVYEGKTYTQYEARQVQRRLETAMREEKLKIAGYRAGRLKDDAKESGIKLNTLSKYYIDFSEKAKLRTQFERAGVA